MDDWSCGVQRFLSDLEWVRSDGKAPSDVGRGDDDIGIAVVVVHRHWHGDIESALMGQVAGCLARVPFADETRGVTRGSKDLRKQRLPEPDVVASEMDVPDACADKRTAGVEGGPGGGAGGFEVEVVEDPRL